MSSVIFTETSDAAFELHEPIATTTDSQESLIEPSLISSMKIGGVDKMRITNISNDSGAEAKPTTLSPIPVASSSKVMMNHVDYEKADTSHTQEVCSPIINPVNADTIAATATSILTTDKEPVITEHQNSKMLDSSQDGAMSIQLCNPLDTPTNPCVPNSKKINNSYDNDNDENEDDGRIQLGICAMDKKARSKPMAEILSRIDENLYRVVFFGDSILLNDPPSSWPKCDALIAFFSKGYPLQKVKEYVKICKPYVLNDLDMQEVIQDRRRVYDTLEGSGIDVPRHVYLSRDGYKSTGSGDGNGSNDQEVIEHDDYIVVNGITIQKPFVEKPVNAENHNIAIYYPTTAGGGCKKLFRKIGNRSSEFYPDINEVRRDGSYIYEEFVETQGTDVKMYTVGPGM
jgi:hypothetical protein